MESDFESKSRCASLRPAAMATGSGWGVEGSRGTLEGYIITLLVQHNPHTHTPLTYHLHTPTSLTSSPPPLTYTLTPSPPSLTPPLHIPHTLTRSKQFLPSYVSQCIHIRHARILVFVHLNEPPPVQLDPVWSIPRSTMLASRPTAQRRQSTPEISWGLPSSVWGTRLTVRESPVFLTSPTCGEKREWREGGMGRRREG